MPGAGAPFAPPRHGAGWCKTNILRNLEKMWGTWHIITPLSEKVGGRVPRAPHLIAPMLLYIIFSKGPVRQVLYLLRSIEL